MTKQTKIIATEARFSTGKAVSFADEPTPRCARNGRD